MPRRGRRGKGGWLAFKKTDGPAGRALYLNQGDDDGGDGGGVAEPPERETSHRPREPGPLFSLNGPLLQLVQQAFRIPVVVLVRSLNVNNRLRPLLHSSSSFPLLDNLPPPPLPSHPANPLSRQTSHGTLLNSPFFSLSPRPLGPFAPEIA